MDRYHRLLLDVWREACRHIEIAESTNTIVKLLSDQLPISTLVVRRFDYAHQTVDSVAAGQVGPSLPKGLGKVTLSDAKWKRLIQWGSSGKLLQAPANRRSGDVASVAPEDLEEEIVIGPLVYSDKVNGALIVEAKHLKSFRQEHVELFQGLLEPFSVALENDRRLHELATLREAAEADRRSLLNRLGRQEMAEPIVGSDSGLRFVMDRVEIVATSDLPVLILGETGTGKEVVSRAIHNRSPRASGPFIRVNCGAIPPELIDSHLFGHEKGSFTGAGETRAGWFERADGGTLFLDEMGELPLPAQVRLLRVLQDGFIERVGGNHPIRVDVRIVAATHRDLASMVKDGKFREDLWYRVNVFPIYLPRLRERREDIPALVKHFSSRAANRFGLAFVEPTKQDLQLLMDYSWPGNIRELGAVIDRAVILGRGERLEVEKSLGVSPVQLEPTETVSTRIRELHPTHHKSIETLDQAMKFHIELALERTKGKIEGAQGAAAILGINPHTLRARMRKLKINWNFFRTIS